MHLLIHQGVGVQYKREVSLSDVLVLSQDKITTELEVFVAEKRLSQKCVVVIAKLNKETFKGSNQSNFSQVYRKYHFKSKVFS